MISNAYTLLIIYARIDITPIYIVCLSFLLVVEEVIYQFKLKIGKLNGDLLQPSGIRYEVWSFSVRYLISIAYWKGLIFGVKLSIVVPQAIGTSLHNSTRVTYHPYAMGPRDFIWGTDWLEFKPKRWLNKDGHFISQSPFKFNVFQKGAWVCLGKDMVFIHMKYVAETVVSMFRLKHLGEYSAILSQHHSYIFPLEPSCFVFCH